MARNIWSAVIVFVVLAALASGCGEEDEEEIPSGPNLSVTGPDLLGLRDNRVLNYMRVDTIITWIPSYSVREDTGTQLIRMDGADADWIIRNDSTPTLNLRVSSPFILLNGQWRTVNGSPVLVSYPEPAAVMNRAAQQGSEWTGDFPAFTADTGNFRTVFYWGYFGFYFEKEYAGQEEIFTPVFAGKAYKYEVELYGTSAESVPAATITEWYAPNVGMVRQEFNAAGIKRTLVLRSVQ